MYTIISEDIVKARQTAVAEGHRRSRSTARDQSRGSRQKHRGLRLAAWRNPSRVRPPHVDQGANCTAPSPSL